MVEIFANISNTKKEEMQKIADMALLLSNPVSIANILANYTKACCNEEEQEFADFYFNMRLEELKENNDD